MEVDISIWNIFCLNKNGLRGHTIWQEPRKVSEKSHENKARAWTKFKNFFTRLTGMKKLIFHQNNFLSSGHFLIHEILKNRSKNDRSQKSYLNEKSVLWCPSTTQRNFWILFMLWLYFHDWFLILYEALAKLCDLGGHSYLDKKCSICLCLPPLWCTKLGVRSASTLLHNTIMIR